MMVRTIRNAALTASAAALIASTLVAAETSYISPSVGRLKADVTFLADDKQEGRAPGTAGIEAAADYIAKSFQESGLKPAPGAEGYFQKFTVKGSAELAGTPKLAATSSKGEIVAEKADISPLAIGSSADVKGLPIVFAGYGITAHDRGLKIDYDDYDGIDVKGKAVLILRREPQMQDENSVFGGKATTRYATFQHKLTNAFQQGAKLVLFVNDIGTDPSAPDTLMPLNQAGSEENSPVPMIQVTRNYAEKLLDAAGMPKLATLEKQIDETLKPRSKVLEGVTVSADATISRKAQETKNVIGVLEGEGPYKDETIVVGGHYDHLGRGGFASGSLAFLSRDIHNGADDNASGTAMVMELARRLAKRTDPLPRRVVFMAFSGEEKGLLGSQHYVDHPLIPLAKTVMMINFDMVGRLNDKSELTVFGTGSSPGVDTIVEALGTSAGFKVKKVGGMSDGIGGSDHESFYQKKIPVLFPFTGIHPDYHRPSDDSDKINYDGMARIADFGELLLLDIARRPKRPEYVSVAASRPPAGGSHGGSNAAMDPSHGGGKTPTKDGKDPARAGFSGYIGSIPDYSDDAKGVKLSGVREGSPADKAGLKGGDVIIGFGGKPIATIYDYTESIGRYRPGDKVEVKVKRGDKEVTVTVTVGSRPGGN